MPADALALALLAAVVHAAWNLLFSGAGDAPRAAPVAMAAGAIVLAPFAILAWDVEATAWPFIGASAALEAVYLALLGQAYVRADFGFVYPVARGIAPVLVLVAGVAALGTSLTALSAVGVLGVVAGIALVRGVAPGRGVQWALGVGACIAAYTLVDDHGVDHAGAVAYLFAVFALAAAALIAVEVALGNAARVRAAIDRPAVLAGAGMAGAYLLTLWALQRSAAAPVAAVRETSVVFGVLAAAAVGRERLTASRLAGAFVVAAGVAALAVA